MILQKIRTAGKSSKKRTAPEKRARSNGLKTLCRVYDYTMERNSLQTMERRNESIVADIQRGNNKAKEELCIQNEGLCQMVARQFRAAGEHEDLLQTCYLALLEAAESFDLDKGNMFSSWAVLCMRARIYRGCNSLIALPEYLKSKVFQYRRFLRWYETKNGREATDDEIMSRLSISTEDLAAIRRADIATSCCSLHTEVKEGHTLEETIASEEDVSGDIIRTEYEKERSISIWKAVDELPKEQAETLRRHYIEGESLSSIGPKARANESKALRSLRRNKSVSQYYDDIRSSGMKGTGAQRFFETWMSATERTALHDLGEL